MRLDQYLVTHHELTRSRAQLLIADGSVCVQGIPVTKASKTINSSDIVSFIDSIKYVSRAGLKLEKALELFQVDPLGKRCLDIGSSTGGFTECLLQREVSHVDAVDVGTDQLVLSLRNNSRVTVYEQTDIRNFKNTIRYDLIVCDASFISLTKIIPEIPRFSNTGAIIILLIKPQFEVGKEFLGKRGIVTDEIRVVEIITDMVICAKKHSLILNDEIKICPIKGGDGNQEYIGCFTYQGKTV